MKRSTRMSIIAGVAVFLTLVSGISFAAWTASSAKTATATTGSVAVTTGTSAGASTFSTLGPSTYTASNQTVTKSIVVQNTGSVATSLKDLVIARSSTSTLTGSLVSLKLWVGSSTACATSTPIVSTTLSSGTVSLSGLPVSINPSSSAILCASTTFTGNMTADAGKSLTATLTVRTNAGTSWIATDSQTEAKRTITQSVFESTVPNAPTAISCENVENDKEYITLSWTTPSGFTAPNGGYNVYLDNVLIGNTTNTSTLISNRGNNSGNAIVTDTGNGASGGNSGNLTVRAVASNGSTSASSAAISLQPRNGNSGIACG
ncbi:hypothetical protein I6E52_06325 [Salinibacterium sp. NG253]|uniref:hypothetical protein n=1 Tax=Salinibacterium sp. NG253 TaxID=2792039 RepID=UPI0018CFA50E|nr:hypothetical protein [Salinibacterium sp. NG253]MBH0116459.1 hypothetical protein [Salinibacterium sp. NG253]